ncbi:contact-dependent growth inhibition system immunity protein [Fictibacillus phosphorivorans]|uniref:contact-dependent growth inhibition system immunity protein n=1 Tax=Fictibacillus phosphorivorans TaxID=1221500 RepID=UPI0011A6AF8D|nr:contact-dependent growth inhibition system immunity protein [Fictibacillus phosphorivorans]
MDETYEHYLEQLEDFLGGTFHQGIISPEQALDDFIKEVSKECLLSTINDCENLLNSSLTKQEKETFIKNNTEVYFPAIKSTPLKWLSNLIDQMKEGVKTNKNK